jgi:hypothetical protein
MKHARAKSAVAAAAVAVVDTVAAAVAAAVVDTAVVAVAVVAAAVVGATNRNGFTAGRDRVIPPGLCFQREAHREKLTCVSVILHE